MKYNFYNMKPQKPLLTVRLMWMYVCPSAWAILYGLNLCNKETLKVPAKIKRLLMPLGG